MDPRRSSAAGCSDACLGGGAEEAGQVRVQLVQAAVHDHGRVEDAVAAVHHVVVDGDGHHRGVQDDAAHHAGVHGPGSRRSLVAVLLKLAQHLHAESKMKGQRRNELADMRTMIEIRVRTSAPDWYTGTAAAAA
jgi:hypothetical protein